MIVRSRRKTHFTVIDNGLINDGRLDWKELGLLVYLLSKPDHWEVSPAHLAQVRKTKVNGIYAILKRLREIGYVRMQRQRSGKTDWIVYDMPHHENHDEGEPHHEKPHEENPHEEKPREDNPIQVNTEYKVNTDCLPNTETTAKENAEISPENGQAVAAAVWDEEMVGCFRWGQTHYYWAGEITSTERFVYLFNLNSPKGIRAQYRNHIKQQSSTSGVSGNATRQQPSSNPSRNLTPAERIAVAAGCTLAG